MQLLLRSLIVGTRLRELVRHLSVLLEDVLLLLVMLVVDHVARLVLHGLAVRSPHGKRYLRVRTRISGRGRFLWPHSQHVAVVLVMVRLGGEVTAQVCWRTGVMEDLPVYRSDHAAARDRRALGVHVLVQLSWHGLSALRPRLCLHVLRPLYLLH